MTTRRMYLLVAETDHIIGEVIAHFSNHKNCEVTVIQNGIKAVETIKKQPLDIIVVDILLPKLDGIRVCSILKQDHTTAHIPILVLSLVAAERKVLDAGADAFLLKPPTSAQIIETVEALVTRPHYGEGTWPIAGAQ